LFVLMLVYTCSH